MMSMVVAVCVLGVHGSWQYTKHNVICRDVSDQCCKIIVTKKFEIWQLQVHLFYFNNGVERTEFCQHSFRGFTIEIDERQGCAAWFIAPKAIFSNIDLSASQKCSHLSDHTWNIVTPYHQHKARRQCVHGHIINAHN